VPQKRIVLRNCDAIDPKNITTYLDRDGHKSLEKAYGMAPEQIIEEVKASALRGRGGAGFPCGLKWELTRKSPGNEKYVICNADEGEVGTFKDRYILEKDPFTLIEAMAIAGYAIGAKKGFIYLRAEYYFLLDSLLNAIEQAREKGFLERFAIDIRLGAGAYVCGEESALMESIEGKRGDETLMNIPQIILNGAGWFSEIGTERSKGTKVFSISGDVRNPGVYELVLGSQLKELVEDLALAERVKMVQIGGATGRIIPYNMIDTPLSFETILGAGAITIFDESRDAVEVVYRTMEFLAEESCGKCSPCREGTEVMVEILERLAHGQGSEKDITLLEQLSEAMILSSMCGLGQAAPNPVMDSLQYFRDDYEKRIREYQSGVPA